LQILPLFILASFGVTRQQTLQHIRRDPD